MGLVAADSQVLPLRDLHNCGTFVLGIADCLNFLVLYVGFDLVSDVLSHLLNISQLLRVQQILILL